MRPSSGAPACRLLPFEAALPDFGFGPEDRTAGRIGPHRGSGARRIRPGIVPLLQMYGHDRSGIGELSGTGWADRKSIAQLSKIGWKDLEMILSSSRCGGLCQERIDQLFPGGIEHRLWIAELSRTGRGHRDFEAELSGGGSAYRLGIGELSRGVRAGPHVAPQILPSSNPTASKGGT